MVFIVWFGIKHIVNRQYMRYNMKKDSCEENCYMRFDKYYFTNAFLENEKANKHIKIRFEKGDRFYSYLLPFLHKGKVEGLKLLKVDTLYVSKENYDDLCGKTYKLTAEAVFKQKQPDGSFLLKAGAVVIDRVCIENINPMNVKPISDDLLKISMCDMEIQYQSGVQYGGFKDKEEE